MRQPPSAAQTVIAIFVCGLCIVVYALIGVGMGWKNGGGVLPIILLFAAMGACWRVIREPREPEYVPKPLESEMPSDRPSRPERPKNAIVTPDAALDTSSAESAPVDLGADAWSPSPIKKVFARTPDQPPDVQRIDFKMLREGIVTLGAAVALFFFLCPPWLMELHAPARLPPRFVGFSWIWAEPPANKVNQEIVIGSHAEGYEQVLSATIDLSRLFVIEGAIVVGTYLLSRLVPRRR